jgi:hypothetical protein
MSADHDPPGRPTDGEANPIGDPRSDRQSEQDRQRGTGQGDPIVLLPPLTVSLDPEEERQAVRALADLLADWWQRREQH